MDKKIVILNSSGGKGKGTFVAIAKKILSKEKVYKISSVDQTKAYATLMGWTGGKTDYDRWFLANLKSLHTKYNDGPFNYIVKNIKHFFEEYSDGSIMFIDIREPDEIQKLVNFYHFPICTCLIDNENVEDISSNHADSNASDYNYDYIIDNNSSLEQFEVTVKTFIDEIFKNKI